jgi:hypothetical protein
MLDQYMIKGAADACERFHVKHALLSDAWAKIKGFGTGQVGAAKDLWGNLRGGLGGASNLGNMGHMAEGVAGPILDIPTHHRQLALNNLKTLAPSLLAGGGLYLLHRHRAGQRAQEAQQRELQQQMMQQQLMQMQPAPGGYPMM